MIAAELRKWRSPGVLSTVAAAVMFLFVLIGLAQANDAGQWSIYTYGQTSLSTPQARDSYCQTATGKAECHKMLAEERRANEELRREIIHDRPYGAETQHPLGSGGVVAGWMASMFGLVVVAALAAWLVSAEWSHGTARVILACTPRRWKYAGVKLISVWGVSVSVLLVLWASLAAAGPLLRALYEVAPAAPDASHLSYAGAQIGRALVVLALYAAVATAVGLLVRNALAAFAVTTLSGVLSIASSAAGGLLNFSPAFWIASWMRYTPSGGWTEHLWPSLFPLGNALEPVPLDATVGLLGIVGTIFSIAAVTVIALNRRGLS